MVFNDNILHSVDRQQNAIIFRIFNKNTNFVIEFMLYIFNLRFYCNEHIHSLFCITNVALIIV